MESSVGGHAIAGQRSEDAEMGEIERHDERDPQDTAEGLDEEVVFDDTDTSGDEYGNGLPSYPPDRWVGDEADASESGDVRGSSEAVPDDDAVGQLVEPNVSSPDDEEELLGEAVPGRPLGAEETAVHVEREG